MKVQFFLRALKFPLDNLLNWIYTGSHMKTTNLFLDKEEAMFPTPAEIVRERRGEMTVKEAAKFANMTRQGITKAIREQRLKARRVGETLYLISAATLADFLDAGNAKRRRSAS